MQVLANSKAIVYLKTNNTAAAKLIYDTAAARSRSTKNPLTNQPYTVFGPLKGPMGLPLMKSFRFTVTRKKIKGNFLNDVEEFLDNAIKSGHLRVRYEVKGFTRNLV